MSSECACGQKHQHGASRSVVRQIGNHLPINTGKRLYIQLPNQSHPPSPGIEVRYAATGERLSDGLRAVSLLKDPDQFATDVFQLEPITEDEEYNEGLEEASFIENDGDVFEEDSTHLEGNKQLTMEKISALEGELAKLKAQIAVYALAETRDLPVPAPPPPPPPPPTLSTASHSQATEAQRSSQSDTESLTSTADHGVPSAPPRPAMSDVLRDLGSVKLRTVNAVRSPGGTPLRKHNTATQEPADNDPASIIATALRKKFANRVFQDSPDKENLDRSDISQSGFDSPSTKLQFN